MTNIKPLGTLVLVEKIKEEENKITQSGLIMPSSALDSYLGKAKVIAVGEGTRDIQGNLHPLSLKVGDVVYFNDMNTVEVIDDQNQTYSFIAFSNLYGKVTQDVQD